MKLRQLMSNIFHMDNRYKPQMMWLLMRPSTFQQDKQCTWLTSFDQFELKSSQRDIEQGQSQQDSTFLQDKLHNCFAQFVCLGGRKCLRYMLQLLFGLNNRIQQGKG